MKLELGSMLHTVGRIYILYCTFKGSMYIYRCSMGVQGGRVIGERNQCVK